MEAVPMFTVLLGMLVLPVLGFRYAARHPMTTVTRRVAGAVAGGLLAGAFTLWAAYVSDSALAWSGAVFALGFPVVVALLVALGLEGARWVVARHSSEPK